MSKGFIADGNLTTRGDAQRFAKVIKKYWADRGYHVRIDLTHERVNTGRADGNFRHHFATVSNLVGGLPPDYDGELTHFRSH